MRSKFAIAGHPLHPALVSLPIGLFIWTLIASIVFAAGGGRFWYDIAFWTGFAAWISALVAALPGFGDFLTLARGSDAQSMALVHMALNLSVVALYIVAWALMLNAGATSGGKQIAVIVLQAVGTGLLALSGWLGGELVYRHHLAMVPDDADLASAEDRVHHAGRPGLQGR